MQLIITASSDSYITNKIIDNSYRSSNSNAGSASTLDLFKLYEESGEVVTGSFITSDVREDSVILIKFDTDKIGSLTSSILNISDPNFKAVLELKDISSGLQKPHGFYALCNPLAKSFEEGSGFDVNTFGDLGSVNYLTSSFLLSSPIVWNKPGAKSGGGTGKVRALGSISAVSQVGLDNTATFSINDGTNTVTFTANNASETPAKTDANDYTFGINNVANAATLADRIFAAVSLSKTNSDLAITATNPGDGALVALRQDVFGPTGNTDVTLGGTSTGRITKVDLRGGYDTNHLDFYDSGSLNGSISDFGSSFYFSEPNTDAYFDVTKAISGYLRGDIPNYGFRISFSGSYATDNKTRFVKRFASRHVKNKLIQPRLRIKFNESEDDESQKAYTDKSLNFVIKSFKGLGSVNFRDNSNAQLTGDNCGKIVLTSGSFKQEANFSQINLSSNNTRAVGQYKASINIQSNNEFVRKALEATPKGFFLDANWKTLDEKITFRKEKIKIRGNDYQNFDISDVSLNFQNRKESYKENEDISLLINASMNKIDYEPFKKPTRPDVFQGDIHYRITEKNSGSTVIDLDFDNNSTKLYFYGNNFCTKILAGTLSPGYLYEIEFFTPINSEIFKIENSFSFKVI